MKKLFAILLAILSLGTAQACMKKNVLPFDLPFTLIVMDTTQALLSDAQVRVGKQTFTTSFDGRVVLKPEQIKNVRKMVISCEGYVPQKVSVENQAITIVRLTPKMSSTPRPSRGGMLGLTRSMPEDVVYAKAAAAPADAAVLAEESAIIVTAYGTATHHPAAANTVSAGKLTAGEVNDFAKWNIWPNYLQTAARFQDTWKLAPVHRYTIQVKNQDGYPIANYPVSLTDQQGNTIFQAVTDNTGKAELWNGLVGGEIKELRDEWKEGLNTIVVDEPCDAPEAVDVMFVFDATGSMSDELHYLQAEMKDVIGRAKEATGGLNIRTGAVVYRDHGDDYLTRISRLTEEIATTQAFIDKQQASGGGDFPEAVPEALMAALNSAGWDDNARARIAFLVLDAPCHGDSATLALLHEQILNAAAIGVRVVPVVCSSMDDSGEFLMRSIALATNGTTFFLTDDSGIGNPHLQPHTDSLKVEHLNDMLVRTIVEFSMMPTCDDANDQLPMTNDQFIPDPFSVQDLEADPTIPHGEGIHYLVDISGKLLGVFAGEVDTSELPIGVYFIKTFYDGKWFTQKILVH